MTPSTIPIRSLIVLWIAFLLSVTGTYAWQSDNGDGTYTNPVLHADYSDPDIIRVGSDFYMVSSSFTVSPGLTILRSKDMVNWEFAGHAADPVGTSDAHNMVNGQTAYEGGFWAPSIRHHNGVFYIAVQPTFDNGRIYYASNPAGPWNYHQLDRGIYDPGFFIDTDGTGYIISGHGPQSLMVLNSTYSAVVQQIDNYLISGGEGTHVVKRGGFYYAFNANPGVWPFQLRCSRTQNLINGPWETGHICLTATTGGHQGAIVDINDSDQWFGFVHQDSGAVGRMPRIGPVFWENDWPVFGTATDRDNMAATYPKPVAGQPIKVPATSDDFSSSVLGLQWQWNHNPDVTKWSLTERPGHLRLRPGLASEFWKARNTLTQKSQGPRSQGVVKLDLANMQSGDIAGFGTLGKISAHLAVSVDPGGTKTLGMKMRNDKVGEYTGASGVPVSGNTLYLRTDLDFTRNLGICAYSTNGTVWTTLGGTFPLMFGLGSTWQGEQFALFCYNSNTSASAGYVDVDSFTLTALDDTADLVNPQRGRATLNATRTTFVADNGQLLRGPYESTEWTTAAPEHEVARIKELGCNTVHLYAESFDPNYPNTGSTAPGYAVAEVDKFVQMTRDLGLYLVITIGNGANNGNHNRQWAVDFWNHYAPRYANETHVLYEIHNEPVAWGPSYLTGTTPSGALDMEVDCYNAIRAAAPNIPVLLFTYAVLGETGGANAALTDIHEFNQRVFGNPNAVWTNEVVGFHGYAGWKGTAQAVEALLAAGYPCMMTEFIGADWGSGEGQDIELTSELERMGVSWNCFLTIPPYGVSPDVTQPEHFKDMVERSGLSWTPDFGTWPVARSPYGNSGQPRKTTADWTGDFLHGATRIEIEDFDLGGQGVAYNDADTINHGGQYRPGERIDIETTADTGGGHNIGWTNAGEWLEYTIWVAEPGTYDLGLRIASVAAGGVRIECNGLDKTGDWSLPNTGGWQTWTTQTKQVFLEFGRQKLRIQITNGAPNLNWIELTPSATGPIADGICKLVNRHSGLAMDGAGNEVVQNAYSGATAQQWQLEHVGAGNYRISSVADNDRWTNGGLTNDKIGLVFWWGADAQWQRFLFRPAGEGFQRIVTANFGREFEPQAAAVTSGAFIVNTGHTGYDGSAKQQWAVQDLSAPGIPTGLHASYGTGGGIGLGWNAVTGASGYVIKRSVVPGGPYTALASGVTATTFTDATAIAEVDYYYVISSLAGATESLNSGEATAARFRAWLRFDETAGTTAADSSSNGWDGTLLNGPVWMAGKYGNAVNLDGVSDHVTWPSGVVSGLNECTVCAWVNLDTISNWARVFDFGTGTDNYMMLTANNMWTNVPRFAIRTPDTGEQVIDGNAALTTNAWNHVAVTLKGNTGVLYINGIEAGRNSNMTLVPDSLGITTQNHIGKSQFADPYLDASVDDFRIYGSALGATDIVALMTPASVPAVPTGLVAAAGDSEVTLNWNASDGAAGYNVKRATVSGGPYTTVATNVAATGFMDTGLPNGMTFFYVVSAVNPAGESADSAEASATPRMPPPSVPTGLIATSYSGSASLTWNPSATATGYNVRRATASGGPFVLVATVPTPDFTDSGLLNGAAYYYVVSAVNPGGESDNSSEVTVTPGNTTLSLTSLADQDGYLRASSSANTAGGTVYPTTSPGRLGDDSSNRQYKAILSFDTSGIPMGATVLSATVKMKRSGLTGTNPFTTHGVCLADIKGGGFNGNTTLESADFQAPADVTQVATMSNPSANNSWSAGILNSSGRSGINKGGITQFRIYFSSPANNDNGNDYISWYSSENATGSNRPVLEVTYGEAPPDTTMSTWLKFDETSGITAVDSTGNGYNGTVTNGPAWTSGYSGNAVALDGLDDHVSLPGGVVSGHADLTISTWVMMDNVSAWSRIFDFGTGTDNYMFLTPRNGWSDSVRFAIRTPGVGEQVIDGTAPLSAGVWNHVAVILSGSVGTLYVNGVAVGINGAMTLTPNSLGVTTANHIGKSQFPDPYLDGKVDDFRIYNSALGASAIAALATQPPDPQATVVLTATAGDAQVSLAWSGSVSASSYQVKRAAVSGGPYTTVASEVTSTGFTDIGLTNGTAYYYVVSTMNGGSELAASAEVGATPSAPISERETRAPLLRIEGGHANVSVVSSVLGHFYQLQYSDDLAGGSWLDYGTAFTGTGGELTIQIPFDGGVPRRFYRVWIQR